MQNIRFRPKVHYHFRPHIRFRPKVKFSDSVDLYDLRKFGFSNRVVNKWNSLPNWVVSANTTNTFKARLEKFWHNQDIVYDIRAQLQGTGSRSEVFCEKF